MKKSTKNHNCNRWPKANILATVLGLIFFWPIGLVILFWSWSGRHVKDLPAAAKQKWHEWTGENTGSAFKAASTDNEVFNEYQNTQYDRIREIEEEIQTRASAFQTFRSQAKRRAQEKEFEEFMDSAAKGG
ncbi:MAG: DUF2852 domain-containing protein [Gammaproteobacteria bacterium]|nr:DUF2852 domain-containing protein [Gammaproteobacteria bacterium]